MYKILQFILIFIVCIFIGGAILSGLKILFSLAFVALIGYIGLRIFLGSAK